MKEELTREIIEEVSCCDGDCDKCLALKRCCQGSDLMRRKLATALLEEMDKPKVWDGAPEDTKTAEVCFFNNLYCDSGRADMVYTRELPKTRARQIAEEVISENVGGVEDKVSLLTDLIETALEKYAAELKGEE